MVFHYPKNITLKALVAFMDLFNNIQIAKWDAHGNITRIFKVPINFASREKLLSTIENIAHRDDINLAEGTPFPVEVDLILPRIAVSLVGLSYDPSRKLIKTRKFYDKEGREFLWMPVPYNLELNMTIISKTIFDLFQILEQILPFFSPEYSIDIKMLGDDFPSESVPVVLNGVSLDIPSDLSPQDDRIITAELSFVMKIYYHYFKLDAKKILKIDTNIYDMDTYKRFLKYTIQAVNEQPLYPPDERDKEPKIEEITDEDG